MTYTIAYSMHIFTSTHDWLCNLATFIIILVQKRWPSDKKPIILVKIFSKLLYVIQGIENSFDKVTSWPQMISEYLVTHALVYKVASD